MFSKGDDLYFLSYNILLILYSFECKCGVRVFKDFRKLAFLTDFVSNRSLAKTVTQKNTSLNSVDRDLFTRAFADGLLRINHLYRLLYTLEKKGLVKLEKDSISNTINVCLTDEALDKKFFDQEIFKAEFDNIKLLKNTITRTTALTLETLLTKLFDNYGIKRWVKY